LFFFNPKPLILDWLQSRSALGELLNHDYGNTGLTRLYTISAKLIKHQTFLSSQEQTPKTRIMPSWFEKPNTAKSLFIAKSMKKQWKPVSIAIQNKKPKEQSIRNRFHVRMEEALGVKLSIFMIIFNKIYYERKKLFQTIFYIGQDWLLYAYHQ
jgi:hypothetical protein